MVQVQNEEKKVQKRIFHIERNLIDEQKKAEFLKNQIDLERLRYQAKTDNSTAYKAEVNNNNYTLDNFN